MSWTALNVAVPTSSAAGLGGALSLIQVDPFQSGGDQLSFPNAVDKFIQGLSNQPNNPVMAVAVSGSSMAEFSQNIGLLAAAVPLKPFEQMSRRALSLAALEVSKWALPQTVVSSAALALDALPTIKSLASANLLQTAAAAADTFKSSDPLSNLAALATEKTAHAATVASALSDAQAGLSGGAGWRFYAATGIEAALKLGHPVHDQVYTGILAFVAPAGDLQLLTELFP